MYIYYFTYITYLLIGTYMLLKNFSIIYEYQCRQNDLYYYTILSILFSYGYWIPNRFEYMLFSNEKVILSTSLLLSNLILIFYGVDSLFLPNHRCYKYSEDLWTFGIFNLIVQLCFITYVFIITAYQYYLLFSSEKDRERMINENKINIV